MRRSFVALATASVVVVGLVPAARATTVSLPYDLVAGPVLTGDGVAVATKGATARTIVVRAFDLRGRPRMVRRTFLSRRIDIAGSQGRFAYVSWSLVGSTPPQPVATSLVAGPSFGPWSLLLRCGARGPYEHQVAVSGSLVALSGAECLPGATLAGERIQVMDTSGNTRPLTITAPAGAYLLASNMSFAGRYLAWLELFEAPGTERVVVFDTVERRVAYAVGVPNDVQGCDVGASGLLVCNRAASSGRCADGSISWYGRGAPVAHDLPIRSCLLALSVSGRRIAIARPVPHGRVELALLDLGGAERTLATVPAPGAFVVDPFRFREGGDPSPDLLLGFDGQRLAWVSGDCGAMTLHIRALDARRPEPRAPRTCPARVARHAVPIDSRDHARLAMSCPNGCHGIIFLSSEIALPQHNTIKQIDEAERFALRPRRGPSFVSLRIRLSRPLRRLLATARRLPVTAQVTTYGVDGVERTRTAELTLRRRPA